MDNFLTIENGKLETKINDFGAGNNHDDYMRLFEHYQKANDERLAQIEKRMSADVLTVEKLARLDQALDHATMHNDALALKNKRPSFAAEKSLAANEHKNAFNDYIRKGETQALFALESKAMSISSPADGGYLVPIELESELSRLLSNASPFREICDVRQVSGAIYQKPFSVSGLASGWVGETNPRPETAGNKLAQLQFPTMELYAMPSASQSLLDDSAINLEQWLAKEIEIVFAEQETQAFVMGNGVQKPKGFIEYPKTLNANWSWGNIGYLVTGVVSGMPAANPSDILIDLVYTLKAAHRQNARWMMNRRTQSVVRKLKDGQGNYIWQPAAAPGGSSSLMNFPITECEYMPDIGNHSFSIAFGDFKSSYLIVDRIGTRILRDPYSAKPYVLFYTTKRVGGGMQNFESLKFLRFGTG